jgi:hypothetical protein
MHGLHSSRGLRGEPDGQYYFHASSTRAPCFFVNDGASITPSHCSEGMSQVSYLTHSYLNALCRPLEEADIGGVDCRVRPST